MNKSVRTLLIWIAIFVLTILIYQMLRGDQTPTQWQDLDRLRADAAAGSVIGVRMIENRLDVELADGSEYSVYGFLDEETSSLLVEQGVAFEWDEESSGLGKLLWIWGPVLLIVGLWIYFMKKMGGGSATNIFELRKSPARLLEQEATATFADVGGCGEAKEQLGDVVSYLRDPKPWISAGARVPRGTLLEGAPGCGKTLLARAVAGETDAKFYVIAASEFVEMFVGVGAARVRDLFETARKNAPAVIFIDELDAVGRRRGSGIGASHDEREQTLNQLLVCLDGLERSDRVVVIAATNRPDVLDSALVRPGRIDRRIVIPLFERAERREILEIHTRAKALADDVDLDAVAAATDGASGADLEALVNEAAVLAVRRSVAAGGKVPATIAAADLERLLAARAERVFAFDRLDMVLVESTSQMSEVTGRARAGFQLTDGTRIEGEVVWADAFFVKIQTAGVAEAGVEPSDGDGDGRQGMLIPKAQILSIQPLAGTEAVDRDELAPDQLAGKTPDLA